MLEGSCFLDAEGVGAMKLEEGDFVLLPEMPGFTLASEPGLRLWQASPATEERGLLAGLSDPGLACALREIHVDIARRWTVEQLAHPALAEVAQRVGYQSASAFSTAFTRLTGCPPSDFARSRSQ